MSPSKTARRQLDSNGSPYKLGELVAQDIEERIVTSGWPIGTVLGSEASLLEEYDVSRAVLREAIRLLEHHDVAAMRRGPGGGLVVTAPDSSAVVRATALQLDYQQVTPQQLFEARMALELNAVQLAAERVDEDGIRLLREALEKESEYGTELDQRIHDLHVVIATLTGNPAMKLFIEILTRLTVAPEDRPMLVRSDRKSVASRSVVDALHHAHEAIIEAIVARDPALARHRMHRHLEEMEKYTYRK